MKFLKVLFRKRKEYEREEHERRLQERTDMLLRRYEKTFKDLARYDRGEKIFDGVSK